MEALQMLKFSLKQKRLDFTAGLATPDSDMVVPMDEEIEVLARGDVDSILALIGQDDEEDT
jgi:hypothetical protein